MNEYWKICYRRWMNVLLISCLAENKHDPRMGPSALNFPQLTWTSRVLMIVQPLAGSQWASGYLGQVQWRKYMWWRTVGGVTDCSASRCHTLWASKLANEEPQNHTLHPITRPPSVAAPMTPNKSFLLQQPLLKVSDEKSSLAFNFRVLGSRILQKSVSQDEIFTVFLGIWG